MGEAKVIDLCSEGVCCREAVASFKHPLSSSYRMKLCRQHLDELQARAEKAGIPLQVLDVQVIADG